MTEIIRVYLPWVMSAITIYSSFLAGNLHRHTWLVSMGNQVLWLTWIIATETWGFIPLNIALWIVYARNHLKWKGSDNEKR